MKELNPIRRLPAAASRTGLVAMALVLACLIPGGILISGRHPVKESDRFSPAKWLPKVVVGQSHSEDGADIQVLNTLKKNGADLSKPREVIHYIYTPTESDARNVASVLKAKGFAVEVNTSGKQWETVAKQQTTVSLPRLRVLRTVLNQVARQYSGVYDGWEAAQVP